MAAYKYSYGKWDFMFKNPAEVAGRVCQTLAESETGLTPESLLDASRDEDAPLHDEFEWDDTVAAEKYRREQARQIIRFLIIERVDMEEIKTHKDRSFVYTGEKSSGYVPLKEALNNEKWRTNLLKAAYADMNTFVAKYHRLEELSEVIKDMRQVLSEKDAG